PVDNNTDVHFTVTFSENVTGVSASDFALNQTGTVAGSTITGVSGSGSTYAVTVHVGTGVGTVRLDVTDDDSIKNLNSIPLGGSGTTGSGNGSFTTGEAYTTPTTVNTTTAVSSSATPSTYGQSVTFTATVSPAGGASAPTGSVAFVIDGGTPVAGTTATCPGGSPANSSCWTYSTSALTVNGGVAHTVQANYSHTGVFSDSSGSLAGGQTVNKASATVVITWSTPQTYNSSTHPATAVVNGVGGDTNLSPAATFEYFSGSSAGTAGTGTATAPTAAGTYTVRASFAGNGNYDPTSAVKTIVIDKASATVAITWSTPQTYNSSTHPATAVVNGVGGDRKEAR